MNKCPECKTKDSLFLPAILLPLVICDKCGFSWYRDELDRIMKAESK